MRKNVLFVSSALDYFDSSASNRNRLMVQSLSKYCNVYSIEFVGDNCAQSYESDVVRATAIPIEGFRKELPINSSGKEGKNLNFIQHLVSYLKNKIRFFIPDIFFLKLPLMNFERVLNEFQVNFDFVITSSDPKGIHTLVYNKSFIKNSYLHRSKFLQYWGDPLYGDVNSSFKSNLLYKLIEFNLLRKADRVLWVSLSTLTEKSKLFSSLSGSFVYLPRPLLNDNLPKLDFNCITNEKKVKCCYIGDYYSHSRDLKPLLKALVGLEGFYLNVAGNSDCKYDADSDYVNITNRVPNSAAESLLSKSAVCFVLLNKEGSQIPGKIYDLVVTDKVIIVLYTKKSQVIDIPFQERLIFCLNDSNEIRKVLLSFSSFSLSHPLEEYSEGDRTLHYIINNVK